MPYKLGWESYVLRLVLEKEKAGFFLTALCPTQYDPPAFSIQYAETGFDPASGFEETSIYII